MQKHQQLTKKRESIMKSVKSVEEQVEDCGKRWLTSYKCKYFTKTDSINGEIDQALKTALSKTGGTGGNYPDIRLLLADEDTIKYPVVIEVKGLAKRLDKFASNGVIDDTTSTGEPDYRTINNYAVNGAVHYAKAIINHTKNYKNVIAIGLNGYIEAGELKTELGVYYVSVENLREPIKVDEYSDLSFLASKHFDSFIKRAKARKLSPAEIEAASRRIEERIEKSLKSLNQAMHDELNIAVETRVQLITGLIMAGLGEPGKVAPLEISDLKGQANEDEHDGIVIINKVSAFLKQRDLPSEKRTMIIEDLSRVFLHSDLWKPDNDESKLKTVYKRVKDEILPVFTSQHHLDFTGRLFNILNDWVDVPDGGRNDVVLTPRYVTAMMAKLAKVDQNSYVWDYAAGSAGFLVSSMKIMLEDADKITNAEEKARKKAHIRSKQLLGIEKLPHMYLLAVLNMILMQDGSANILHKNSLTDYEGNYEQGDSKNKPFPANVFLLNPPYSAKGKGFVFVEKALSRMTSGRAVILIQENAGAGNGQPYTKELLKNNTLLASIHMADIFRGKAGVQTAVYVFEIGKAHDTKQIVKFIDMSNDGYLRQNRKKSGLEVNLRNVDHAEERYQEVIDIVNDRKCATNYFTGAEVIKDTITLSGNDWTFSQHKKIDSIPTEADFMKVVSEYLAWEVGEVLRGEK